MDNIELTKILSQHALWIYDNKQGTRANLQGANLQRADLRGADLQGANLRGANLQGADLQGADLREANLQGANLQRADLREADLQRANLREANLQGALGLGHFIRAPKEGPHFGYKKSQGLIVKLLIPYDAKRVNCIGSNKCRCDKAFVESITVVGSDIKVYKVASDRDKSFTYKVGEEVVEPRYDPSDRIECSTGIHYFMTKEEAMEYNT